MNDEAKDCQHEEHSQKNINEAVPLKDSAAPNASAPNEVEEQDIIEASELAALQNTIASIAIFQRLMATKSLTRKYKKYPYAFVIEESIINKLDNEVRLRMKSLKFIDEVESNISVGYSDLSVEEYDNLDKALSTAGNRNDDPERLTLTWVATMIEPLGSRVAVSATFVTEKRLESQLFSENNEAFMTLDINGPSNDWCRQTFDKLDPYFQRIRISGLYRPLLVFKNHYIVRVIGITAAILSQSIAYSLLSRYFNSSHDTINASTILSQSSLESKFNSYIEYVFQDNTELGQTVFLLVVSLLIFITILTATEAILPRLVPRSSIVIGLVGFSFRNYQNVFRFIVFDILVLAIGVPLILQVLSIFINLLASI